MIDSALLYYGGITAALIGVALLILQIALMFARRKDSSKSEANPKKTKPRRNSKAPLTIEPEYGRTGTEIIVRGQSGDSTDE